jgi:curved DNA-binding protein CbpA
MLLKKLAPCTTNAFIKAKYVTVAHDHWPQSTHPNRPLTPYEILDVDPSATYTKARFTELVKLYHPDRCDHPASHICSHLPPSVRLERYRLIVAAHTLLSNPMKRQAYDTYGAGWTGASSMGATDNPFARANSGGGPKGPFTSHMNATWEDWERWRWEQEERARTGEGPRPRFVANSTFASGILAATLIAALIQQTHIESVTATRRSSLHERSSQAEMYIRKAKEEARARTRSGRIEEFMKQRDPAVLSHPRLSEAVTNPDLCASFGVPQMDKKMDMSKKFK